MRIAFLITAYRDPLQLTRLTHQLFEQSPDDLRHVQLDCAAPTPRRPLAPESTMAATRAPISWGDGSYLTAIIDSFRSLLSESWDWTVLLSGQDLLVRPLSDLHQLLESSNASAFAPSHDRAAGWDDATDELRSRYWYQYHWWGGPWHRTLNRPLSPIVRWTRSLDSSPVLVRTRPKGSKPGFGVRARSTPFSPTRECHFGSDYVALNRNMVVNVLRFIDANPAIWRYFCRCYIPSEAFFASVLRWLEPTGVADLPLHFMHFGGLAHPRRLTADDLPAIAASGAYFARKFEDADHWTSDVLPLEPGPSR